MAGIAQQKQDNREEDNYEISEITVEENIGLESCEDLNEIASEFDTRENVEKIVIAENRPLVRDKNFFMMDKALQELGKDYIVVGVPDEEYAMKILGGETEPEVDIDLLLTDNKMEDDRGGIELAEYAYPRTDHIALYTTTLTLPDELSSAEEVEDNYYFIDTAHFKMGDNDLKPEDYKDLID